jgi:predicted nucleic acid-binding protein
MRIEQRIKNIEDKIKNDVSLRKFFKLIQVEPNSKEYQVEETYKNHTKEYIIDNLEDFYKVNDTKDNHILRIDIVDNSHLEKYLYEEG